MPNWQNAVLASTQSTSGTAFVDATGFSFTALANTKYAIRWFIAHQSVLASTGIKLAFNGPAGFTLLSFDRAYMISLTATVGQFSRAYNTGAATSQVDLADSDVMSYGRAQIVNVTLGTVIVRFGSEVNLSTVRVMANSLLQYRVVP